ncbi:MAG TPA: NAD(P)-binding domain-containing protein [Candidatus Dormibacteraeota bacterium]|nr:NAD(P)-binding domain-containing protein [Candidatus Dormibacteraeota bacterium]
MREQIETLIIGGGQSGLAVGYHLAKAHRQFLILEANERTGDSWRKRWDSLRVFSPAKFNGLPGMRFPAPSLSFPTKDAVADFQESYATRFKLPVRTSTRVDALGREGDRYVVSTLQRTYEADNVVIATGANQVAKVPPFASELNQGITQMHSSEYKSPAQLREGDVLVVGTGNSGAELSFELSKSRRVWLAGSTPREVPFKHGTGAAVFALPMIRILGTYVLTLDTPMGKKAQPQFLRHGPPLIRVKMQDLIAAGVERAPRVTGVRDGLPLLADDRALDVANVIWCTGFKLDFGWVHMPVFGADGRPIQYRGTVESQPGLYFMGLEFQYAAASGVLPGIARDARYVARHILDRVPEKAQESIGEYAAVSMPK